MVVYFSMSGMTGLSNHGRKYFLLQIICNFLKKLKLIFFLTLPCNKVISIMYIFTLFVLVNTRCVKINDELPIGKCADEVLMLARRFT